MKRCIPLPLLFICLIACPVFAQTVIPGGPVSGHWTLAGSPYLVEGEITVPTDSVLNIEAGVEVIVQGYFKFIIDTNATLQALGGQQDTILFTAADPDTGWHGLRFFSASDSCRLEYCRINYGLASGDGQDAYGGGLYISNTCLSIAHCTVSLNQADYGGGICITEESEVTIVGSIVSQNLSFRDYSSCQGGGILCNYSNLNLDSSSVINNRIDGEGGGTDGGGIYCYHSNAVLSNCQISDNTIDVRYGQGVGSGICCKVSSLILDNCIISGNSTAESMGGGVYCDNQNFIINCSFLNNVANRGGGLYCYGNTTIDFCLFYENSADDWGSAISCGSNSPTSITHCIIYRNISDPYGNSVNVSNAEVNILNSIFAQNINGGVETHSLTNVNYCAFYNNLGGNFTGTQAAGVGRIFQDPLFLDPENGDFSLQAGSPCIDTGDPRLQDPDGTRSDIGILYFDHSDRVEILGSCWVLGQTIHSGTKIHFQAVSGGAVDDSTFTVSSGRYRIYVQPGFYDVTFTHSGYEQYILLNQDCTSPMTLPDITLLYQAGSSHLSGRLNGVIEAGDYFIDGDVFVSEGDSLTIAPGVTFLFDGGYMFEVRGYLQAVGTEQDSIRFMANEGIIGWNGLRLTNTASDSSRLEFCLVTGAQHSGIECNHCNPTIANCRIVGNVAKKGGGGILCIYADPWIDHCVISGNSALLWTGDGGGVLCRYSNPVISSCEITNNDAISEGGGIYCVCSEPVITDNVISGNSADSQGGGIFTQLSTTNISNSTISGNYAGSGGGIRCSSDSLTMDYCTISGNTAVRNAGIHLGCFEALISNCIVMDNSALCECGGLYVDAGATITNCTIVQNSAGTSAGGVWIDEDPIFVNCTIADNCCAGNFNGGFRIYRGAAPVIKNCIHWGNDPPQIYRDPWVPPTPSVTYCNFQDTLFWGIGNISQDPLFVDPENGDYHLQSLMGSYHGGLWLPDPSHSPCIDAGDPASPFQLEPEPNGDRINMGAYGNTEEASLSSTSSVAFEKSQFPRTYKFSQNYPNPFNSSARIRFGLPKASMVSLKIYDICGRLVATLVDRWYPAGYYQASFDASDLASGIYLARIQAGDFTSTRKMVLVK